MATCWRAAGLHWGRPDDMLRDPNIVSAYLGAGKRALVTTTETL
jgi:hypothetical protein